MLPNQLPEDNTEEEKEMPPTVSDGDPSKTESRLKWEREVQRLVFRIFELGKGGRREFHETLMCLFLERRRKRRDL